MKLRSTLIGGLSLIAAMAWATPASAHCDTLDGPVVAAARKALDTGNVDFVLVWVQKDDEAEIRSAFQRASIVRKTGAEAKELADVYFFETLVRVHRAGEGAPFTGLKAAGQIEPAVSAADKAIETGKLQPLAKVLTARMEQGLHDHFDAVTAKKRYNPADLEAGRAFTHAYVQFVHYAEGLYDAAKAPAPDAAQKPAAAHTH